MKRDTCEKIVRKLGVGWLFEETKPPKGNTFFGNLGDRNEGLVDINVYRSSGVSYIVVPSKRKYSKIGSGYLNIGLYLNLPNGSNTGLTHTILSIDRVLQFYERGGVLYFTLQGPNELFTLTSESLNIDVCSGDTLYVRLYRDALETGHVMGLEIYGVGSVELPIPMLDLTSENRLVIGGMDFAGSVGEHAAPDSMFSGLYLYRGAFSREDTIDYWLRGLVPSGTHLFLRLDEGSDNITYDCSGNEADGWIENFEPLCRGVHERFFSWQNMYGYSTGAYEKSYDPELPISDDILIPALLTSPVGVYGRPLEHVGRANISVTLERMRCLSANGTTYARLLNPQPFMFRPGQDVFTVLFVVTLKEDSGGTILSVGNRYEITVSSEYIGITLGGVQTPVEVGYGEFVCLLEVGTQEASLWVNGQQHPVALGTTYGSGGFVDIMNSLGEDILHDTNLIFLGVVGGYLFTDGREEWFTNRTWSVRLAAAYYFGTNVSRIFDVSGSGNHFELADYEESVWSGRQSVMPYLLKGFSEVHLNRQNMLNPAIVPFTNDRRRIDVTLFPEQVVVDYESNGGLPVFDGYINMNPEGKTLGFWSQFWNKLNTEVWVNLNNTYMQDDPYLWNIQELNMDYLALCLSPDAYNYVFTGNRSGRYGIMVEVVDTILLNMGNNIVPKPMNI